MKRVIKTVLALVLVVSVLLTFSTIYLVKFSDTSFVGEILKEYIIKKPQLVSLFNLQKPGDGRFSYLSKGNKKLGADIYLLDSIVADDDINEWINDMILETTGRQTTLSVNSLDEIEQKDEYSDDDLNQIIKLISENDSNGVLNIVYLLSYKPEPEYLGITVNKNTIFIFKSGFQNLNEKESVLRKLEQSTIMHEWGHLLGLKHLKKEECIMSEKVHFYSDRELWTSEVPTQYCPESLYEIKVMTEL
jgi:predicted Zn-dependent protease